MPEPMRISANSFRVRHSARTWCAVAKRSCIDMVGWFEDRRDEDRTGKRGDGWGDKSCGDGGGEKDRGNDWGEECGDGWSSDDESL